MMSAACSFAHTGTDVTVTTGFLDWPGEGIVRDVFWAAAWALSVLKELAMKSLGL